MEGWVRRGSKPIGAWSPDEWKQKISNNAKTRSQWTPERRKQFTELLKVQKIGKNNPNWKNENICLKAAEERDHRKFEQILNELNKLTSAKWEVHHINSNGHNHNDSNIALVTRKGHMILDGRLERLKEKTKFIGGTLQ